ncbi:metal-sensing transcriptional repressor [Glaciimonas soli]|uniref:Metal-sensing transcriptional repressor n=1 Tax=Glaciimonas soli TaxID=2590999 RepID=A0A843YN70_9BURK|nr:metal-sensing transcriptional repressor [Glaciimonas soli]MQQ99426.1 metal-sensing transcriptional repressor [Glaciimonas soli]
MAAIKPAFLRVIREMIGAGRICVELAQQLHAIEKAITNAKKALIHDHIAHCLEAQMDSGAKTSKATPAEFKEITRYL